MTRTPMKRKPKKKWKKEEKKFIKYFDYCDPYDIGEAPEESWEYVLTLLDIAERMGRMVVARKVARIKSIPETDLELRDYINSILSPIPKRKRL